MWAASAVPLQGVGASIEELALSMVVYPMKICPDILAAFCLEEP
jgi:hypothetical protein